MSDFKRTFFRPQTLLRHRSASSQCTISARLTSDFGLLHRRMILVILTHLSPVLVCEGLPGRRGMDGGQLRRLHGSRTWGDCDGRCLVPGWICQHAGPCWMGGHDQREQLVVRVRRLRRRHSGEGRLDGQAMGQAMMHELEVLILVDGRSLLRGGVVIDLDPAVMAVMAFLLTLALVMMVMLHSYLTHHTVHRRVSLVCQYPAH